MPAPTFTNTNEAGSTGVKMLVYGGPGAGKTRLIPTLPNPVIASAEGGLLSIRGSNIPVVQIRSLADIGDFYNWCKTSPEAKRYQSVGIDSISEIMEVLLANAKAKGDMRGAYGEVLERGVQLVRMFRDLPFNVYISAKMEMIKDESGKQTFVPLLPGQKLGPQLPYFFDEVFHRTSLTFLNPDTGVNQTSQVIQVRQTEQHSMTKDRSGKLDTYEPPDLGYIINKILGVK